MLTNGSGVAVLGTVHTERQYQCDEANDIAFITARKRSLGQGNIFTSVCYSVLRGIRFPECITGHMTGRFGSACKGVCLGGEGLGRPPCTTGYGQ